MQTTEPRLVRWFGRRGARLAIVISGLLYFVMIVGAGALVLIDGVQGGRWLRALVIGGLAVIAFVLWVRIVIANWRALRRAHESLAAPEDTGIWGVGGPAMREPGNTGIVHTLRPPRADRDEE